MKLLILTPKETLFDNEAISVTLPGKNGKFQVLNQHAPMISMLKDGEVNVVFPKGSFNEKITIYIKGGVCEVGSDSVIVLCD